MDIVPLILVKKDSPEISLEKMGHSGKWMLMLGFLWVLPPLQGVRAEECPCFSVSSSESLTNSWIKGAVCLLPGAHTTFSTSLGSSSLQRAAAISAVPSRSL